MPFVQLILETSGAAAEHCSCVLTEAGALAISFEDAEDEPLFELEPGTTPLWTVTRIIGLFEPDVDVEQLTRCLRAQLKGAPLKTLKTEMLEDQDWVRVTRDQFKPQRFGTHLWVCPPWCEVPDETATVVWLDPGLAFGTGAHPTTRLCLEALSECPPLNARVLDYGCGSGILGIAALKLGAKHVLAVDHDPQALSSTQSNAILNGLSEFQLERFLPPAFAVAVSEKVDLILANILAAPILELMPLFSNVIKPGGKIVLSGILEHECQGICGRYALDFGNIESVSLGEWVRITAVRY